MESFYDKERDLAKFQLLLSEEQEKTEKLEKEIQSLKSLVPVRSHREANVEATMEPLVSPPQEGKHSSGPITPSPAVGEDVTVPSGVKDDPRPRKVPKLTKAQQSKEIRDLSSEVEELKQELQIQTTCCAHEAKEAKRFKEECQKLDKYLLELVQKTSEAEARATQAENTGLILQDHISGLEVSLASSVGKNSELQESLDLGKERIRSLEDRERNLSLQAELQENRLKDLTDQVSEVRH